MGSITSLKCVLTQEHLDAVCAKYFVPEEVHPQLPNSDATMHERPTGKVGMYTRFFDYANYRIPFSNFFVSVLTHFRIPFSQLSVFGSAKVSHFEILCRVCNIEPDVSLFRYFYTHNYKNGWFGFTKRPNVRACYSKNLDSVKNWNDHFFWVDEFVVPANARFKWFSGSTIAKDRAPAPSEYDIGHVNTLIAHASPFLRFPEEFLCWVGISRNYLLNKDTYPRFEYEDGEEMDLNAFIRTADPRKVKIVERARVENEIPIVTVAKHRTVTLLPTSVPRTSGELSASVEREFAGDASIGDGADQGVDSVVGGDYAGTSVPVTEPVVADIPRPKRSKKKRVVYDSEGLPVASHPPKKLRADYGDIGGSATGGKSLSALNRLLETSRLSVEQGVPTLPTLPFITSSVTASPLEEGGDRTDSVTGPSLRTIGPSVRFVVLSDSSHHSGTNSAGPEVDSLARSDAPLMTEATTVTIPTDVTKDKSTSRPPLFGSSSSSEKTDRTLSLFTGRSGSGFDAGSIREEEAIGASSREFMCWSGGDKVSGFEATESSLRGEVASAHDRNVVLEQECTSLQLKVTGLESIIAGKDQELSDLGASSSSLRSENQSLLDQVHKLELSSADLREFPSASPQRYCGEKMVTNSWDEAPFTAGIEHGQAGRCLTDLEAYIPSAEDDFNSAIRDLRALTSTYIQELSNKKDASTWEIMDLLRLDDTVAETLGMADLQPDADQLMVPIHHKRDGVIIGSQALSVALNVCRGRVEKMERNLIERLPFLKDVFASIEDPLSAEALIEPSAEAPATNVLSTVVIVPPPDPSISVEDYDNPDPAVVVPENTASGLGREGQIDASAGGGLSFSQLDDEARDVVL
ncbi:hypothetical protein Tco_1029248 [Tanacetum coccineum]|uniref:Transposase (putative) gypsy type domain-containing protein n=1 Tax=Tanacetum coccineum TaxID=301880 RepID=A0ABQ5G2X4_9ASTR